VTLANRIVQQRPQPVKEIGVAAVGSLDPLEFLEELDRVLAGEAGGLPRAEHRE
jgi:hypothetical protein